MNISLWRKPHQEYSAEMSGDVKSPGLA